MDEHDAFPAPTPRPALADTTAPSRAHGPVIIATVTTAALVVAGGVVGFAVGTHSGSSGTRGLRGAPSSELLPGQGGQLGGQLPSAPKGAGPGTSSHDTTSRARGAQLTGLVRIVSTMKYADGKAAGTGMVLTSGGEVITNHHVVQGATKVKVTVVATGASYTAKVVGTDAAADVAVLQLEGASGLKTITPDQDAVSTGEEVTAVGDGNGTIDHLSAATGKVVATDQAITTQSDGTASGESLAGLIEISSDVVSGYSGGATYDAQGEVLGMTTAASKGSNDVIGYAVPIATVLKVADDLEAGVQSSAYSYGHPAFLGIGLSDGTAPTVARVYDATPADKAGISVGDTIIRFGGTAVSTATQLQDAVAAHAPGDSVGVIWTAADGSSHTATVTLVQGPVK